MTKNHRAKNEARARQAQTGESYATARRRRRTARAALGAPTPGLVHLRTPSAHSRLDAIGTVAQMIAKVKADGQTALALTDHQTVAGRAELRALSAVHRIKPILGLDLHFINAAGVKFPITVLSRHGQGDLNVLLRQGHALGGSRRAYRPSGQSPTHANAEILAAHRADLIVLAGHAALVPLRDADPAAAESNLDELIEALGRENVLIDIGEHCDPGVHAILPDLVRVAAAKGLNIVAVNDAHYVNADDWDERQAHMAKVSWKPISELPQPDRPTNGYHLATEAEMRALRPEPWWQVACDNTVAVAARCTALDTRPALDVGATWLVTGPSGSGRTQLGRRLIVDHGHDYDEINVIDLAGNGAGYADLIGLTGAPLTVLYSAQAATESLVDVTGGGRELLVVDGLDWIQPHDRFADEGPAAHQALDATLHAAAANPNVTLVLMSRLPLALDSWAADGGVHVLLGRAPGWGQQDAMFNTSGELPESPGLKGDGWVQVGDGPIELFTSRVVMDMPPRPTVDWRRQLGAGRR